MYSGNNENDGHSLGGSGPPVASPAEMRQRRLAALGAAGATTATGSSSGAREMETAATYHAADNDESAELQAALAMSLQTNDTPMMERDDDDTPTDTEWYKSSNEFLATTFHAIMWDSLITTDNDKMRWVHQGIQTREALNDGKSPIAASKQHDDDPLALIGSDHGPWGLTQAHGGPCGVLAAVREYQLLFVCDS